MQPRDISFRAALLLSLAIVLVAGLIEFQMGRRLISKSGRIQLWSAINSPELSQQIADVYSFTHIIHGIGFYAFFRLVSRKRWPAALCLVMVMIVECSWEVVENTPFAIERYRRSALAAGYYGDTILNSMFDSLFCGLGFALAARLRVPFTIAVVILIELTLLITVRDNLTLNILNLIHPFKAIQDWQTARGF